MTGLAKVAIPTLGVLLVAAGITGAVWWGGAPFASSTSREDPATPAATPRLASPPIDAAAPARTETATFALG
jgi:hypothetical protein